MKQQVQQEVKQQVQQEVEQRVQQEVKKQIQPDVKRQVQREILKGKRKRQQELDRAQREERKWTKQEELRGRREDRKWARQELLRARKMDRKYTRQEVAKKIKPVQQQMVDHERRLKQLENERLPRNRKRVSQPRRAARASSPTPAGTRVQRAGERGYKKYSKDEDDHIVLYLVQHPDKIKHAKSAHTWAEALCDPVRYTREVQVILLGDSYTQISAFLNDNILDNRILNINQIHLLVNLG